MKVILLKDVPRVGKKNEAVDVADGYAINYLIPKKLAETGTEKKIKRLEERKQQQQDKEKVQEDLLIKELGELKEATVTITEKANERGHLFKGINAEKVAQKLEHEGYKNIGAENIILEKPLKEVGEFTIKVESGKHTSEFQLNVEASKE